MPAQRELATTFGVGRSTLLMALRQLEQSGLVTIRPGATGGAYVTTPDIERVSDSLDLLFLREGVSIEELGEFREMLEGRCLALGVTRAAVEELAAVQEQFDELVRLFRAPGTTWPDFLERELQLHEAVAGLSHNRVSQATLRAVDTTMNRFSVGLPARYGEQVLEDWHGIVQAIVARDPVEGETRLRRHISYFNAIILANWRAMGLAASGQPADIVTPREVKHGSG